MILVAKVTALSQLTRCKMKHYTPTGCEEAAQRARDANDFAAAARLELLGAGHCLGHKRADRHLMRAEQDAAKAGSPQGWATEEDIAKYMDPPA